MANVPEQEIGPNLYVQYARTNYRKFALKCKSPLVWNMVAYHAILGNKRHSIGLL